MNASKVISARLEPAEISVLDAMVASGIATDRTAALRRMIAREGRRQSAEHDAAIYAAHGPDPDMDELAAWASEQEFPDLD